MNNELKASINQLLRSKRGFEFEAAVNEVHLIRYGTDGYQPTRERKDQGAEGVITDLKTVVAAYGPDAYDEKKFTNKVNDDFDDFLTNWAPANKSWKMYYNGSLSPEQIKISEKLLQKANEKGIQVESVLIKGIDQTMQFLEDEFSNKQLRQLAQYLGVSKELVIFDQIRAIVDDLIRDVGVDPENVTYNLEIDINEKFVLNFDGEDIDSAFEEYTELATDGTLKKIWGLLSTYGEEDINTLKMKVKRGYNLLSGTFKERFNQLTLNYVYKYSSGQDDDYEKYIRSLLFYCFEQCMIGAKTDAEKLNQTHA